MSIGVSIKKSVIGSGSVFIHVHLVLYGPPNIVLRSRPSRRASRMCGCKYYCGAQGSPWSLKVLKFSTLNFKDLKSA